MLQGQGQVLRSGTCSWKAARASVESEGGPGAAEAPTSVVVGAGTSAWSSISMHFTFWSQNMQVICCEMLIYSFNNLNISKGIIVLK